MSDAGSPAKLDMKLFFATTSRALESLVVETEVCVGTLIDKGEVQKGKIPKPATLFYEGKFKKKTTDFCNCWPAIRLNDLWPLVQEFIKALQRGRRT